MVLPGAFAEVAAVLLVAAGVGLAGTWLRQPLIVSFILVGLVVGPAGFGLVAHHEQIELFASVGIALLLFVVGLKLDLQMVRTVGPVALATGLGQVVFTSAIGYLIVRVLGYDPVAAIYIAVALTFSSTIIIVKLLSDKREIDALHGRIAIGLLIVQDLCVIAALIALTSLGGGTPDGPSRMQIAAGGVALVTTVLAMMRWVMPVLARALARSTELLVLFAIAWAVSLAAIAEGLGFSREVGAFLAGVSLASTPYRDSIGSRLVSVRDFLLLFFFIDLGSRLELGFIGDSLHAATVLSIFVLIGNPIIVMVIMGTMGYRKRTGFMVGLAVAQISEFSLILGALGVSLGHISPEVMGLITSVGLLTITLSTYLIIYSGPLYERLAKLLGIFERKMAYRERADDTLQEGENDILLFGLGRYGGSITRHLLGRGRRVVGVDFDPEALARWRERGLPVFFGDAADPELFEVLPLRGTKWVISTTPDLETNRLLLQHLAARQFDGRIAIACRSAEDADALQTAGATLLLRPFLDAAEQAADAIMSASERLGAVVTAAPGLREVRLAAGSMWAGVRLAEIPLSAEFGVAVLAVNRPGRSLFHPGPDVQLFPGDRLILTGEPHQLDRAVEYLGRVELTTDEADDVAVEEIDVGGAPGWLNRSIAALDLRQRFGVTVVGIRRHDAITAPDIHVPLGTGDTLLIAGRTDDLRRVRAEAAGAL
jgi:Kef-type K+ transport system membrane component KefB/Trk K+ transport system NAD-binding subunit